MGIVLVIHLVAAAVAVGAVWAASTLVTSIRLNPAEAVYYGQLASIPLSFLAIALMLAVFLPTTLFRGFVIALIYLVVAVVVWIAIAVALAFLLPLLGVAVDGMNLKKT